MNDQAPTDVDEYISALELCRRLNISRPTIRRHGLHQYALLVGDHYRFSWPAVIKHYQQRTPRNEAKPQP